VCLTSLRAAAVVIRIRRASQVPITAVTSSSRPLLSSPWPPSLRCPLIGPIAHPAPWSPVS